MPTDIYAYLTAHQIPYQRHDHPAVFTVAESRRLGPELPCHHTKNLFVRDKQKTRQLLVVVQADLRVDLHSLARDLGLKGLSLASPEALQATLGLTPGSVTILGLVHDQPPTVEVIIDETLWHPTADGHDAWGVHPLVNTATLVIPRTGIERLLALTGHRYEVRTLPPRATP
jgi:Ala-tRNA(Pro) deacylase